MTFYEFKELSGGDIVQLKTQIHDKYFEGVWKLQYSTSNHDKKEFIATKVYENIPMFKDFLLMFKFKYLEQMVKVSPQDYPEYFL